MALKICKYREVAERFAKRVDGELRFSENGFSVVYDAENNLCTKCGKREIEIVKSCMCKKCFRNSWYAEHHPKKEKKPKPAKVKVDRKSDQTKEIMRLLQDGVSQVEIARKYGISKQRVFSIKKNMGRNG